MQHEYLWMRLHGYTICLINKGQIRTVSFHQHYIFACPVGHLISQMSQWKHVPNTPPPSVCHEEKNIATTYKPFSIAVLCVCECSTTVFRKSIGFTNVLNLLVHEVSHPMSSSGSLIKTQTTHIWYGLSSPASPLNCRLPCEWPSDLEGRMDLALGVKMLPSE